MLPSNYAFCIALVAAVGFACFYYTIEYQQDLNARSERGRRCSRKHPVTALKQRQRTDLRTEFRIAGLRLRGAE